MLEVNFKHLLSCTKTSYSFKLSGEHVNACCSADPSSSLVSAGNINTSKRFFQYLSQLSTRLGYGRSTTGIEKSSVGISSRLITFAVVIIVITSSAHVFQASLEANQLHVLLPSLLLLVDFSLI